MKKTLILIGALLVMPMLYTPASAQDEEEGRLIIARSHNDKFELEICTHMGWGYNIVKTDDFTPSASDEFFVNIAKFLLHPTESFGIELGIDYKTLGFESKEDAFYKTDYLFALTKPYSSKYPGELSKNFSRLRTNTFSAPLIFKFCAGDFHIGGGIEGNLNLTGRIKDKYFKDGKKVKNIEKGIQFNRYTYNFMAAASYADTGIYFKYYPKSSRLMPEGGLDVDFMTVGVILDF